MKFKAHTTHELAGLLIGVAVVAVIWIGACWAVIFIAQGVLR